MPKSLITKWRKVNRSINQMIKGSSNESEYNIINTDHMYEEENYLNYSFTNIENSNYNYSVLQKPRATLMRVILKTPMKDL